MKPVEAALAALAGIVGQTHVLTDPDQLASALVDWTGRYTGSADALVRPGSTAEVADVVRCCRRHRLAVYPQGGNTGLVGGAVPGQPGVVLSTARLDRVSDVDNGQLEAGAGALLATVQQRAAAAGWEYAIDLAARDSATIGGTVATNAGGTRVIRYGMTRRQVVGIECVTGAAEILRDMRGLAKDNTGYHLPSLLCGSEGTLAVVTEVRVQLIPPRPDPVVALVPAVDNRHAVELATALGREPSITAIEYMRGDGLELVAALRGVDRPHPDWPTSVLVEATGGGATLEAVLGRTVPAELLDATLIGLSDRDQSRLWEWREQHTEALARQGVVHKLDVSVPTRNMAEFLDSVDRSVQEVRPEAEVWVFGHLADGNIHVNISGLAIDDPGADTAVLDLVVDHGGSISAEHGIGRAKRDELHRHRSFEELAVFARLKRAFDPDGILNPGILLPGNSNDHVSDH